MGDRPPSEQARSWNSRVPFSERPLEPHEVPPQPALPEMAQPDSPAAEVGGIGFEVDPSTQPMPLVCEPVKPPRPFRLLSPEELSPEEHRSVEIQMTAFYEAQKLLRSSPKIPEPLPYEERYFIWKMIFKMMIPALGLIVVGALLVSLPIMMGANGWDSFWWGVALFVAVLVVAWFGFRVYYDWAHTVLFSSLQETGIRRPRNRWLLLTELNLTVETTSLMSKEATRGGFTSFFNINSWRISFDSAATDDDFLKDRGFVRNGDVLKKTVNAFQEYAKRSGR